MNDFLKRVSIAKEAMRALFPETPLQKNIYLSNKYGAEILLKREDLSPVRSYKIRGALNTLRHTFEIDPLACNFVCASAGNHAQGVAFACNYFDVRGHIFMPTTTPQQKIDKTLAFGGNNIEIKLKGDYFDRTLKAAKSFSIENNSVFLSPFDNETVIEGQASVMAEISDQLGIKNLPDLILMAVGGGGLSTGIIKYSKCINSKIDFRLVEPAGAASLKAALIESKQVTLKKINNFVDGAAVARIGDLNFKTLRELSEKKVLVAPEDRICATIMEILNIEGIVLEPAGALSIDGLQDLDPEFLRGKKVVCIVSGGNFDFERLPDVKERALRYSGKKKYLILRMPQRPGALKEFLGLLGPEDDIARFEYLKKSARNFGSVLLGIETSKNENFAVLFKKMEAFGFDYQDITSNETLKEFVV